jgi:hypothetical protein
MKYIFLIVLASAKLRAAQPNHALDRINRYGLSDE